LGEKHSRLRKATGGRKPSVGGTWNHLPNLLNAGKKMEVTGPQKTDRGISGRTIHLKEQFRGEGKRKKKGVPGTLTSRDKRRGETRWGKKLEFGGGKDTIAMKDDQKENKGSITCPDSRGTSGISV